ncbi:unnamed protein product [Protopolystoma xenopodis]|uniref:Peptidase M14 domain-containing protein n=1 Tax=Protopolystoma xenopodis TaxID=117903 RepID=A0A3S5B7G3_9PLAT|nr:unnamed protein product [Protopolystoma xenopodis]
MKEFRSQLKLYLTVHSYGQLVLTPFGYTKHVYPKNFKQLVSLLLFIRKETTE